MSDKSTSGNDFPEIFVGTRPFKTNFGEEARIVSLIDNAFPLVVVVKSRLTDKEVVRQYSVDGNAENPDDGFLVNTDEDLGHSSPVHVSTWELPSLSPGDNPFHHDSGSMGTDLVRGWMVMHDGFDGKNGLYAMRNAYLYNIRTGQRFKLHFSPK